MTSYFPYYLALFGLLFFISVICCCIKLIDIIDRPVPRPSTMPAWNYANYLQNSPVAVLSPQPDAYLRCAMLAENHGLTVEEYLTSTATGPGLYTSTSRDAISAQYANSLSMNHQQSHSLVLGHTLPPLPLPFSAPPSNPTNSPPVYRIPVPDLAVQPTPSPRREQRKQRPKSRDRERDFRQSSLREIRESSRDRDRQLRPSRSRSSMREREREYPPKYEDICFDV